MDADAIVVLGVGFDGDFHGEFEFNFVGSRPFTVDFEVAGAIGLDGDGLAVESEGGGFAPGWDAQIEGKFGGIWCRNGERNGVGEGIVGALGDGDESAVPHFGRHFAFGVHCGDQTVVGSGHPEVFDKIGPTVGMVVLATSMAEGVHHEHGPAVLDSGGVAHAVAEGLIGAGEVAEAPEVGHDRGGVGVESDLFGVVGPEGVAGDGEHDFVREHLLDDAAGFDGLAGVVVAGAGVFVTTEHSAGDLAVEFADFVVVFVGELEVVGVFRLEVVSGGFAEGLGDVDVVPVGEGAFLHPVGGVAVDLFGEFEEETVAGMVVEPVDAVEIVAAADVLPVVGEELFVGDGELESEVVGHQLEHAFVAGVFVVRLEAEQHDHVRPEVLGAVVVEGEEGAEVAVGALGFESALDPDFGFGDHFGVFEEVGEVAVAFEPVRDFFPAVLTLAFGG